MIDSNSSSSKPVHPPDSSLPQREQPDASLEISTESRIQLIRRKITEWIGRYLPAEICGTTTALIAGLSADTLSQHHPMITAYAAAIGENLGYYALLVTRDMRAKLASDQRFFPSAMQTSRDLLTEFGPAELLDSALIRPTCIASSAEISGNCVSGILSGKIAADLVFTFMVITSYEVRKKFFRTLKNDTQPEE